MKRPWGLLAGAALSLIVIFAWGVVSPMVAAASCDRLASEKAVNKMLEIGVLYKVEQVGGSPSIYVQEPWYLFTFDAKQMLDRAIRCVHESTYTHYYDFRTGKKVAMGGASGLSME